MSQEFIQTDAFTWLKSHGNEFTNFPPGWDGVWPSTDQGWSDEQMQEFLDSNYFRTNITQRLDSDKMLCIGDIVMNVRGAKNIHYGCVKDGWNPSLFDEDQYPYPRTRCFPVIMHVEKAQDNIPVTYEVVTIINSKLRHTYYSVRGFVKDGVDCVNDNYREIPLKGHKFDGKK